MAARLPPATALSSGMNASTCRWSLRVSEPASSPAYIRVATSPAVRARTSAGPVRLDPVDALLGKHACRGREQAQRLQQVARDQRDADVELELPLEAADGDRGVVADHLRRHLQNDLGDHRVDLAGHDRGSLLEL